MSSPSNLMTRGSEIILIFGFPQTWSLSLGGNFRTRTSGAVSSDACRTHCPPAGAAFLSAVENSLRRSDPAERSGRAVRAPSDFDRLLALDDAARPGRAPFSQRRQRKASSTPGPPFEFRPCPRSRELGPARRLATMKNGSSELLQPGSSLGGTWPRACVTDESGAFLQKASHPSDAQARARSGRPQTALRFQQ